MAAWQFALDLIPSAAAGVDGVVAARMTRGQLGEVELRFAPSVTSAIFERVGMMLLETKSWSPNLRIWGDEKVDDVHIWLRGTEIEHVQFRLNVADPRIPLVEEICSLAREVSCVLATRAGAILRPHPEVVLRAITRCEAARFVRDPEEYLGKEMTRQDFNHLERTAKKLIDDGNVVDAIKIYLRRRATFEPSRFCSVTPSSKAPSGPWAWK